MTSPALTVGPDKPVSRAAQLMYGNRVKRLPVVDADQKLIGIVPRTSEAGWQCETGSAIRRP